MTYIGRHRRATGKGLRMFLLVSAGTALSFTMGQGSAAADDAKDLTGRDPFAPLIAVDSVSPAGATALTSAAHVRSTTPAVPVRTGDRTSIFASPAAFGIGTPETTTRPAPEPMATPVLDVSLAPVTTGPTVTDGTATAIERPSATYLKGYVRAATYCPTAGWNVLAALGQVESGHGRNLGPSAKGALGPAQFLPSTWQDMVRRGRAVDGNGDGQYDILDPADALPTAAVKLCDDGAKSRLGILAALHRYNHSSAYVRKVAGLARQYAAAYPSLPSGTLPPLWDDEPTPSAVATAPESTGTGSGAAIVRTATDYLGVPYVWGGTNPNVGLDCSGLVQLVYRRNGVALPRVSRDQAKVGVAVPDLAHARLGDLVAFNTPVSHIGIYVGDGKMINAPRPGRSVEIVKIRGDVTAIRRVLTDSSTTTTTTTAAAPTRTTAKAVGGSIFSGAQQGIRATSAGTVVRSQHAAAGRTVAVPRGSSRWGAALTTTVAPAAGPAASGSVPGYPAGIFPSRR